MMKKLRKELLVLLGVLLIAFALRITTFKYPYPLGTDEFVYYKIAEYLNDNEFPYVWQLSNYPTGGGMGQPIGLYYLPVIFYAFLKPLGFSLLQSFKLVSPVFGVLTLIPTYLLTRSVFSRKAAMYSVVILVVLPAFIYRTLAGFYRGDSSFLFFLISGFYFFLLSIKKEKRAYALLAGLCMGATGLVWNGFLFGYIVLSGFVILYSILACLYSKNTGRLLESYAIAIVTGAAIIEYSVMVQPRVASVYVADLIRYILPGTLITAGAYEVLKGRTKNLDFKMRALLLLLPAVLIVLLGYFMFPQLFHKLLTGYGGVVPTTTLFSTITELRPLSMDIFWGYYSVVAALFILGLGILIKDVLAGRTMGKTFFLVWTLASLFVMITALRYSFIASIPIAVLAGLFFSRIKWKIPELSAVILILFLAYQGTAFAGEVKPVLSEDMYDALAFLSTQEEGAVSSWWSYGSFIQGIAGFPTVVDTMHGQDVLRIKEMSNILLERNESKTLDFMKKYHVKYVFMPTEMMAKIQYISELSGVTGVYYNLIPFDGDYRGGKILTYKDEKGNQYAIRKVYRKENNRIILEEHDEAPLPFYPGEIYISQGEVKLPDFPGKNFIIYIPPRLQNTLLTSLMLLDGMGFNDFKLIFSNSEVKIYKIERYTFAEPISWKPRYSPGERIEIDIKVESTRPFEGTLEATIKYPEYHIIFSEQFNVSSGDVKRFSYRLPQNSTRGSYWLYLSLRDSSGKQVDFSRRKFEVR